MQQLKTRRKGTNIQYIHQRKESKNDYRNIVLTEIEKLTFANEV